VAGGWFVWSRPNEDPDAVWRRAEDDFLAGRRDEAARGLAKLARLRPPAGVDLMLRAQLAMAADRNEEALADLDRVQDGDSMAPQARLVAGQLQLRRGRARAAEKYLLDAVRLDPGLVQAHRELIYIYGMQLRRGELNREFLALSKLTPLTYDNVFHWCLTRNAVWDPKPVIDELSEYLANDEGDRWSRVALAENLRKAGRRTEAAKTLEPLPDSDPEARAVRVRLALDRGDDEAAEQLLAGGPEDHPELARLRGRFALAHHEGPAAVRHFRAAYAAEPDHRDTMFGLGQSLEMVGRHDEAAPFLTAARDYDALGTLVQRATTKEGRSAPSLLRALGAACEKIHRFPEARAWYHLAIESNPLDTDSQKALYRLNEASPAGSRPEPTPGG
jgi:tetratricopeptide (TPR) repeat protein